MIILKEIAFQILQLQ